MNEPYLYVTGGAFLLAFIFGAVGNKTNFCTMGAVSDWVNMGDTSRMRMWLLAIAVAILGAAGLQLAGLPVNVAILTGREKGQPVSPLAAGAE